MLFWPITTKLSLSEVRRGPRRPSAVSEWRRCNPTHGNLIDRRAGRVGPPANRVTSLHYGRASDHRRILTRRGRGPHLVQPYGTGLSRLTRPSASTSAATFAPMLIRPSMSVLRSTFKITSLPCLSRMTYESPSIVRTWPMTWAGPVTSERTVLGSTLLAPALPR